ncbi:glycosyltransferase [Aromatoleum toluolicum]|uniref:Glycosyltransferase n=1 Tax=Aromatoleum toluolicum TaxID=90060 RepID=A0ABX1NGZ8_9RHOO|nr:glycosyltransferase [Aromatoleum toluolicum]NMF98524.1 glycosyltransferase [Aromatoleum toluolicum]
MPMRLLFITAEPCPTFRADVNSLFGRSLPSFGVFSDVVTTRVPNHDGPVAWGGGRAFVCNSAGGGALKHLRKFFHCARHTLAADKTSYQAVQVRDMPFLAAFCMVIARLNGLPFFYWMSYPIPEGQMMRAKRRSTRYVSPKAWLLWLRGRIGQALVHRVVLPGADHVFVQSEHMKRNVVALGVSSARVTPVPMGVDLAAVRALDLVPSDDARLADRPVLVYLGTLDPVRQIEVLFEMLARVRREGSDALLVLIGDTHDKAYRAWLMAKAREAGIEEHVLWTGWLSMNEAWRYVLAGRVGLSPIPRGYLLDAGSPTKVPEYLSLGIPVVCNDNPDQQIAIETSGAGLCVPYTGEDFARAVLKLLNEDDAVRSRRINAGYRYISSNRDYQIIARDIADVYRNLSSAAADSSNSIKNP